MTRVCHPHSQKSFGVRIVNIEMKTGEGYLLDGCRAWTCELIATGIVEAQKGKMMSDLISRQAAIDAICKEGTRLERNGTVAMCEIKQWCIDLLERLPSAQPEPQWIPVSERLPEVGKDVMVCYDFKGHRSVLIGVLYGDEKFHGYDDEYLTPEGRKYRKAVAWMPLPEPYKTERIDE